jgi:hypothetical protein
MSFRNHFDMISLNEPVTHKAKFWQSYVRALKGTEDMRADDGKMRLRPRAVSEFPDFLSGRGIYDDNRYASDPNTRIFTPGYRYMPISRETYGYSPRAIYAADRPRYVPRPSAGPRVW